MSDHLFRRKLRNGKLSKTLYCWAKDETGKIVKRSTGCTDRAAAKLYLANLERRFADPVAAAAQSTTLEATLALLIADREALVRAGKRSADTVAYYKKKCAQLRAHFGDDFVLARLTAQEVDKYIDARRAVGTAEATIAKELGALRAALRIAKRRGLWAGDHRVILPLDFSPEYTPGTRWLPEPELRLLLGTLTEDRAARVAYSVATSANFGEADKAQRNDVAGRLVHIRGTKTAKRLRDVPLVFPWQEELVAYALEHGKGEGENLFAPWPNIRRDIHAACERVEIAPCSTNDFRRTTAHWLRRDGMPKEIAALVFGHKGTKMLDEVYAVPDGKEALDWALRWFSNDRGKPVGKEGGRKGGNGRTRRTDRQQKGREKRPLGVPGPGIEPGTRGFSSHVHGSGWWPQPSKRPDQLGRAAERHDAGGKPVGKKRTA
ncbi:MAG: site-specific integrase [Polyangiaceae bacterium]|nr:site-specific integrase [Polyangiaceae bacterium]